MEIIKGCYACTCVCIASEDQAFLNRKTTLDHYILLIEPCFGSSKLLSEFAISLVENMEEPFYIQQKILLK